MKEMITPYMQILLVSTFIAWELCQGTQCKNTSEESKLHHSAGASGPSQAAAAESQHLLTCAPLPQEAPGV